MIQAKSKTLPRRSRGAQSLFHLFSLLLSCLHASTVSGAQAIDPLGDNILQKVAASSTKQRAVAYSAVREYRLHNYRFNKDAALTAQVRYRADLGAKYEVLDRRGSTKLTEIMEKVLASEEEASRSAKLPELEISAAHYKADFRGTEIASGRNCYIIDLTPKHKSKYLIKGTGWVDSTTFGIVRLEGTIAASVSIWLGAPHIQIEFGEFDGVWLPTHTRAVSTGLLLGMSELEIYYLDYFVSNPYHEFPRTAAESVSQTRQ
jgi:hypothetical protein